MRFDTSDLVANVSALDEEAYLEAFRRADRRKLARIQRPRLPETYYRELRRFLARSERSGELVLGLLGEVENPESVAEMADFFLRMEGCRVSLVGGAFEGRYGVSLRTDRGRGNASPLLRELFDGRGSCGGRGRVAGGQIELEDPTPEKIAELERDLRARALALFNGEQGDPPRTLA